MLELLSKALSHHTRIIHILRTYAFVKWCFTLVVIFEYRPRLISTLTEEPILAVVYLSMLRLPCPPQLVLLQGCTLHQIYELEMKKNYGQHPLRSIDTIKPSVFMVCDKIKS